MARVNHKLVKQRLNEKRSKITDKQFFSSRMLAGHFEDLAAAQTRRYHYNRRVRVNLYWKPNDAFTAATDNMQIRINTGHPLVTKVKGRENRYQIVCGMFAHELGHVLFTDFLSAQTYHNYLDSFKWYPRPPAFRLAADARNEKAFWEYVKDDSKNLQMPLLLCDEIPAERAIALRFGLEILEQSDVMLVCGNRLSNGMRGEIVKAALLRMPITVFDEGLYPEVQKLVTQNNGNKKSVKLDRENFPMAFTEPESYLGNAALFK